MLLTIFTPTYNRAYCITDLYHSLQKQTCKTFEWFIIDDGSTDDTKLLIEEFIVDAEFPIKYMYQSNQGKHIALQKGLRLSNSELFLCVDSDDTLTDDAVEIIIKNYNKHLNENILGFYYKRADKNGDFVTSDYPKGLDRVGITELFHRYRFKGETAIVLKPGFCKDASFPVFYNERFVSERVFYNQLDAVAPMVLCDDMIYVGEYLSDGYTLNNNKIIEKNPYGTAALYLSESVYEDTLLNRAKCYSQYLAIKRIWNLKRKRLQSFNRTKILVRLVSMALYPHYYNIYKNLHKKDKYLD